MSEANETPANQSSTIDMIAQLREGITKRLPMARRVLARSGIDAESNNPQIKRVTINIAGEMLRNEQALEEELKQKLEEELGYDLLTGLPLRDHYLRLRNKFIAKGASEGL